MLSNNDSETEEQSAEFILVKNETGKFLKHWSKIGKSLE
jgi:hypothetical protein